MPNDNSQSKILASVDSFKPPDLCDRLVHENLCKTTAESEELFREAKRYLALCFVTGRNLQMPSMRIDAVWHQFILFTHEYTSFCEQMFGKYMHHSPHRINDLPSDMSGLFVRLYSQVYGTPPPSVWGLQPAYSLSDHSSNDEQSIDARSEADIDWSREPDGSGNMAAHRRNPDGSPGCRCDHN